MQLRYLLLFCWFLFAYYLETSFCTFDEKKDHHRRSYCNSTCYSNAPLEPAGCGSSSWYVNPICYCLLYWGSSGMFVKLVSLVEGWTLFWLYYGYSRFVGLKCVSDLLNVKFCLEDFATIKWRFYSLISFCRYSDFFLSHQHYFSILFESPV